jgi:hypothetical protein
MNSTEAAQTLLFLEQVSVSRFGQQLPKRGSGCCWCSEAQGSGGLAPPPRWPLSLGAILRAHKVQNSEVFHSFGSQYSVMLQTYCKQSTFSSSW